MERQHLVNPYIEKNRERWNEYMRIRHKASKENMKNLKAQYEAVLIENDSLRAENQKWKELLLNGTNFDLGKN